MENSNFKDRKVLILVAGILELLIGLGFLGMTVIIINAYFQTQSLPVSSQVSFSQLLPAISMYSGLTLLFLIFAIGTINCKTWARKLMLIASIFLFLIGLAAFFQCLMMDLSIFLGNMPMNSSNMPFDRESFIKIIRFILLIIVFILFILIPAFFILVFSGKNVAQTFLKYDPKPHWTDRVPMPVLGFCFLFFVSAFFVMPVLNIGLITIFGKIISGFLGYLILTLYILSHFIVCYLCYFQKPHAWKISFFIFLLFTVNASVSLYIVDITEYYRAMIDIIPNAGVYSAEQYASFWGNSNIIYMLSTGLILQTLYLLWSRKFFEKQAR